MVLNVLSTSDATEPYRPEMILTHDCELPGLSQILRAICSLETFKDASNELLTIVGGKPGRKRKLRFISHHFLNQEAHGASISSYIYILSGIRVLCMCVYNNACIYACKCGYIYICNIRNICWYINT